MADYCKIVKTCGIAADDVDKIITGVRAEHGDVNIETYLDNYEVHLKVLASAPEEADAKKPVKAAVKSLKNILGNYIYTTDRDVTLEGSVIDMLITNDMSISVVESCTGGMLSSRLVDVPGVSAVYKMGIVSYSNKAKKKIINVKKSTLEKHGAVSAQVAEEMVKGMAALSKSDVVISTTGIAGPDGGTDKKPVGLVYIGCFVCGKVEVKECHFDGNRTQIREQTVTEAISLARECVLKNISDKMFT